MALNFGKGNRSIAFAPTAAFPLNANSYFEDYDLALAAARSAKPAGDTSTKYYFGQEIAVAQMIDNVPQSAKLYIIAPEMVDGAVVGTLQEVGSATLGDDKSIELVDGVLSMKDFGKRYYKYVAETEEQPAHYELTSVDADNVWAAGLEPKVVQEGDELVIGWFEPNPTTAEGVQDQVVAVQGEVAQAKQDIDAIEENIDVVEENLAKAEEKIDSINDTLYGTEGEEAVEGLVDKVEVLEGEMDAVQEAIADVYTKEEVDGLVSGVFHFKGEKENFEALPTASAENIGHVYQVGDKEFASNGEEWVELGFVMDLSAYATKEYTDAEVKKVQDALDIAEGVIEQHTADIEEIDGAIETINGSLETINGSIETINGSIETINGEIDDLEAADEAFAGQFETVNGKIEALEAADEAFSAQFETVNGKITALEAADEAFETRIGSLESDLDDLSAAVGTASTLTTALFPAVEALQSRIDGLVAVGGEANLINGLTINGQALTPNAEKIIDLPVFDGSKIGLVPVVGEDVVVETSFLSAEGNWIDVAALIDNKIDEAMTWEEIGN